MTNSDNSFESLTELTHDEPDYDYLEPHDDVAKHKIELVQGEKDGSRWLVMDDIYILHKKEISKNEIFWECSGRRRFNCQFKCATFEGEDALEISFMYKLETHSCGQSKLGPIIQKFKIL